MTPERKEEINKQIAWWRQQENWRVNGFGIVNNDPLYAQRRTIMPTGRQRTLHCLINPGGFMSLWFEHGVDFEFTGRMKYVREFGEFAHISFELTWDYYERTWRTLWLKKTRTFERFWVKDEKFADMYPHKQVIEEEIVDC